VGCTLQFPPVVLRPLAKIGIDEDAPKSLLFDEDRLDSPLAELATALRERFHSINARQRFQPGDVVG